MLYRTQSTVSTLCSSFSVSIKQSTGHTHTGHTDRENTPDTGTHTRTTRPPNKHLPQAFNNAQRWRDDGACHLPRPGGWPRRVQVRFCPASVPVNVQVRFCPATGWPLRPARDHHHHGCLHRALQTVRRLPTQRARASVRSRRGASVPLRRLDSRDDQLRISP